MACYCANYYGSVNCHNTVAKFGDRCALCQSNGPGVSAHTASSDQQWSHSAQREQFRRDEEKHRRERVSRTSSGGRLR